MLTSSIRQCFRSVFRFAGGAPDTALTFNAFAAMKKRAALVMASTPGDANGYWMRLLQLKDDKAQPRMPLLRFGQPCTDCLNTSEPWWALSAVYDPSRSRRCCTHNLQDLPSWHDRGKRKELAYLYMGVKTERRLSFFCSDALARQQGNLQPRAVRRQHQRGGAAVPTGTHRGVPAAPALSRFHSAELHVHDHRLGLWWKMRFWDHSRLLSFAGPSCGAYFPFF